MKTIYLDLCAIQRPLDTPNQIRIVLESEAVLGIIQMCDSGLIDLVSSDALVYEAERNPLPVRREHAFAVLAKARESISIQEKTIQRAQVFIDRGLKPLDALHLALAEDAKADYFCTCDDRFLRRAKKMTDVQLQVISPIELIREVENDSN